MMKEPVFAGFFCLKSDRILPRRHLGDQNEKNLEPEMPPFGLKKLLMFENQCYNI